MHSFAINNNNKKPHSERKGYNDEVVIVAVVASFPFIFRNILFYCVIRVVKDMMAGVGNDIGTDKVRSIHSILGGIFVFCTFVHFVVPMGSFGQCMLSDSAFGVVTSE